MAAQNTQKIVLCGAGFLGSYIAKALASSSRPYKIQLSSRNPSRFHAQLSSQIPASVLLSPVSVDITRQSSLLPVFESASTIVSLVGILHGSEKQFQDIQARGAENVARAAKEVGARLVHVSAIGASTEGDRSRVAYWRTKGEGENSVKSILGKDAVIIRPSLVFGPGDSFFGRFAKLSKILPFMPVFGGGTTRFQPVYAGDVARLVEVACRNDKDVRNALDGKVVEAGGPEVFTYRECMQLVLRYTHRYRPILSLPYAVGKMQGLVLERLPENLLTVTQDQVEQLKYDNVVNTSPPADHVNFEEILTEFSGKPLTSVHDILPQCL